MITAGTLFVLVGTYGYFDGVRALGSYAVVAAASVLTELIINRSLSEAGNIGRADVETALERLPVAKKHCAVLAIDALRTAIEDYRKSLAKECE